jgi:hypothetical protein
LLIGTTSTLSILSICTIWIANAVIMDGGDSVFTPKLAK